VVLIVSVVLVLAVVKVRLGMDLLWSACFTIRMTDNNIDREHFDAV
jgi:hypothetical protein